MNLNKLYHYIPNLQALAEEPERKVHQTTKAAGFCCLVERQVGGIAGQLHPSIVIAPLNEINSVLAYDINQPMLLCDSARPNARPKKLQWFRLTDTLKWISHYRFDEL